MYKTTKTGHTIEFFQEDGDSKFQFLVVAEPILTSELLNRTKTHRVKKETIEKFVFPDLEKLLIQIVAEFPSNQKIINNMTNSNPIVELAEKCQKMFRANIETFVLDKIGADHSPTIKVKIVLPNGKEFFGSGSNQKIAKQNAAEKALATL